LGDSSILRREPPFTALSRLAGEGLSRSLASGEDQAG
jgi:hypothetical protein